MRIDSASVQLQSSYLHKETIRTEETLRAWVDPPQTEISSPSRDRVDFSRLGKKCAAEGEKGLNSADLQDLKLRIVEKLLSRLLGRKITIARLKEFLAAQAKKDGHEGGTAEKPAENRASGREGWGMEYEAHQTRLEVERSTFSAEGVVRTADGREISIQVDLSMSRELIETSDISFKAGDALKDPLVINFSGTAAELTQTRFSFDLDADGVAEPLPGLGAGSGYLALDRDGNGLIGTGQELFGPGTGNGFAELAALDDDHNGWIDEKDAFFTSLRVWRPGEGGGSLVSLLEAGVGAIALDHARTPFSLMDGGDLLGRIRATGLYLGEDGSAGTVQQIDLSV